MKFKAPCKHCGHAQYRHILKQGPDHAVCMNMTCPCPNYEPRNYHQEIAEAGERGRQAALKRQATLTKIYKGVMMPEGKLTEEPIDALCNDCGHVYTHHNRLGEEGFIFRRPCGEDDCQCADFAFDVAKAEELRVIDEQVDTKFEMKAPYGQEQPLDISPQIYEATREGRTVIDEVVKTDDGLILKGHITAPKTPKVERTVFSLCRTCGHDFEYHTVHTSESWFGCTGCDCLVFKDILEEKTPEDDPVNHPKHYNSTPGPETIELIRWLSFNRGTAIKYLTRAGKKDPAKEVEDLRKAIWYIEDEIKLVQGEYGDVE